MSDKVISFIQPSRNNLKYLKWSYNSIRKNLGYVHEICMADDFSNDGTWEWLQKIAKEDKNVKIHRNEGPTRLGHTILYDTLINDYATNDIVMIYHADMYALPGLDKEVDKYITIFFRLWSIQWVVTTNRLEVFFHYSPRCEYTFSCFSFRYITI